MLGDVKSGTTFCSKKLMHLVGHLKLQFSIFPFNNTLAIINIFTSNTNNSTISHLLLLDLVELHHL